MGMLAIGEGVNALGTYEKMQSEAKQGRAALQAHNLSADIEEMAAADAIERGKLKDMQTVMRGSLIVAEQRVMQSGSGTDANTGGNVQTQLSTGAITAVDRSIVVGNAIKEAYGLKLRAAGQRQEGMNAYRASQDAEMGTFLSGLAGVVGMGGKFATDQKGPSDDSTFTSSDLAGLIAGVQ